MIEDLSMIEFKIKKQNYLLGRGTSNNPLRAANALQSASCGSALCSITALAAGMKNSFSLSSMLSSRLNTCLADAFNTCCGWGGPMISKSFTCIQTEIIPAWLLNSLNVTWEWFAVHYITSHWLQYLSSSFKRAWCDLQISCSEALSCVLVRSS